MPIVVADTGPLHYLVLIEAIELLPRRFGRVLVPEIVLAELEHPRTPPADPHMVAHRPCLARAADGPPIATLPLPKLGDGERAAIALAIAQVAGATLVLMDDRAGVAAARAQGLTATGTLGVLERAAARGLIDLPEAVTRLQATNFRYRRELLEAVLSRRGA